MVKCRKDTTVCSFRLLELAVSFAALGLGTSVLSARRLALTLLAFFLTFWSGLSRIIF